MKLLSLIFIFLFFWYYVYTHIVFSEPFVLSRMCINYVEELIYLCSEPLILFTRLSSNFIHKANFLVPIAIESNLANGLPLASICFCFYPNSSPIPITLIWYYWDSKFGWIKHYTVYYTRLIQNFDLTLLNYNI